MKIFFYPAVKHSLGIFGMMFIRKAAIPYVFKKRGFMGVHSIHGWFMNFPVDVLFLDDKNIVVDKACVGIFGGYTSKVPGIVYAIEAEAGEFDKIQLGDTVLWNK